MDTHDDARRVPALPAEALYRRCDPDGFSFQTTRDLELGGTPIPEGDILTGAAMLGQPVEIMPFRRGGGSTTCPEEPRWPMTVPARRTQT